MTSGPSPNALDAFSRACVEAIGAEAAARQHTADSFCKCNRVLERVAHLSGLMTPELMAWLRDESMDPGDREISFYERFVSLVRRGVHVEGQGNFGEPDDSPPAHPKFVECRLTERGVQQLKAQRSQPWRFS